MRKAGGRQSPRTELERGTARGSLVCGWYQAWHQTAAKTEREERFRHHSSEKLTPVHVEAVVQTNPAWTNKSSGPLQMQQLCIDRGPRLRCPTSCSPAYPHHPSSCSCSSSPDLQNSTRSTDVAFSALKSSINQLCPRGSTCRESDAIWMQAISPWLDLPQFKSSHF